MFKTNRFAAAVLLSAGIASGCTANGNPFVTQNAVTGENRVSRTAGGAALGAGLGALAGAAVGGSDRAQRNAVLIGAGIGALSGGAIGNYMDRQEAALRAELQATGVGIRRVGNELVLVMPSNITFATDSATIDPSFDRTLASVATVLGRFNQTLIDVNGHTDSTGSPGYNQQLSRARAQSVTSALARRGVQPNRILAQGFGETQPIASNATPSGREQNRRVEIRIVPVT